MLAPRELGWTCRRCGYALHSVPAALDGSIACPECGLVQTPSSPARWKDLLFIPTIVGVLLNLSLCGLIAVAHDNLQQIGLLVLGVTSTTGITAATGLVVAVGKLRQRRFGGRALRVRAIWIGLVSVVPGTVMGIIGGIAVILARLG